jgi:hypothetical protein
MSALQPLRLKKEVPDIADTRQVLIPEADRSILDSDVEARVLLTRWLKKGEVKTKGCSRPILLLTLQPTLQPIQRLMLQQMPQLMLATPPTMQPTLPTSRGTPPQIQDAMQELSLLQSSLIEQKEASDTA